MQDYHTDFAASQRRQIALEEAEQCYTALCTALAELEQAMRHPYHMSGEFTMAEAADRLAAIRQAHQP